MDVPRKVTEIRLDSTEQAFESWRCLMGIAGGLCLAAILVFLVIGLVSYFDIGEYEYDSPYFFVWTSPLVLFCIAWGVSQVRPSIILLGTVGAVLSLALTLAPADLYRQADPSGVYNPEEHWASIPDVISYIAACIGIYIPILFLALRVTRSTPEERAIIALPMGRTFGLVSALQAVSGVHPVCMHLPSRLRRIIAIVLFALCQFMLGAMLFMSFVVATTFLLRVVKIVEMLLYATHGDSQRNEWMFLIRFLLILAEPAVLLGAFIGPIAGLRYLARRFSHTSIEAMVRDDARAPILFLRSFSDDQVRLARPKRNALTRILLLGEPRPTLDHILLEEGTPRGPVVAIGAPGSRAPFGAVRAYISDDNWKQVVSDIARSSQAIVMALDETAGIVWELNELHGNKHTSKVLHLLPPRLAPADMARNVMTKMRANSHGVADLFQDLQKFLDTNDRACVGWYFQHSGELFVLTTTRPTEVSYLIAVRNYLRSTIGDGSKLELPQHLEPQQAWRPSRAAIFIFTATVLVVAAVGAFVFWALSGPLPSAPVDARTQQQFDWCVNKGDAFSLDQRISSCTALIQSGQLSGARMSWAYSNRGFAYTDKKDYELAIADFDQAIRFDPKDARTYNNRGNAYADKGDIDRAIADYDQAIRLDPNNVFAFFNRGNNYGEMKDYDRAIADFEQVIRLDPKYAPAYYGRGMSKRARGDIAGGNADIAHARELDPNLGR
jgi:tetratricopeptide (TPR) repeat protein